MEHQLDAEEFQTLEQQIPNFRSSAPLRYLADRKLLPQQNDIASFENPDLLTILRRKFYGYTRKEQQLIKRQEEALVPFEQEQQIKTKLQALQDFHLANAPSAAVASRTYGVPLAAGQQALLPSPGFIGPMPPVSTGISPGQGFSPAELNEPISGAQTRGELFNRGYQERVSPYFEEAPRVAFQPDPSARLQPYQLQQLEDVQQGRGIFENGQYIPMAQAKPRPDLITPEAVLQEAELNESLGNLPPGTTAALKKAPPQGNIPVRAAQEAMSAAARRQLELSKVRGTHTLDDTAIAVAGVPMSDIESNATVTPEIHQRIQTMVPGAPVKVGSNLKQTIGALKALIFPTAVAGTKAAAQTAATQETKLVSPEKQANYIHAKTLAETGQMVYPTSTQQDPFTEAKAATGGWREITDKQRDALKALREARATQDVILNLGHQLIKAKGPGGAFVQGIKNQFGAFVRSNPIASAFLGDREAFSTWMARLKEVGVLTQQDIERWASVLPDQRDTIGSAAAKEAVLNMLFDSTQEAIRWSILGDNYTTEASKAKKSLSEQIAQAAKLYAKGSNKSSAQDLFKDEFGGK